MRVKYDRKNKFIAKFDPETGFYVRSGVIENGVDTAVDPFMASYPELIDVGIMGNCAHASLCPVGCYQGGTKNQKDNMSLEDYKDILSQSKGKLFQIALGGHGDPNKHENFEEILRATREANIVPNYTTSGFGLTEYEVEWTKKYCGAVAVSWYRHNHTLDAIYKFLAAGCKTNIHFVLSNKTIDEAIEILKFHSVERKSYAFKFNNINAIIFLTHKNVGCGEASNNLKVDDLRLKEFCELISKPNIPFKVGFDSCFIPALVNFADINFDSVDTCEGARYSCYISSDMTMIPCSFDQSFKHGISLRNSSIQQAWDSEKFDEFRKSLSCSCQSCDKRSLCGGGCPLVREIVLCDRKEKSLV